jgi:antitoxin component of MazEF toxin-antitoxin module
LVLKLKRSVSRSGRGLVLRVPTDVAAALEIDENSEVLIWIEDTRMIVKKVES